MRTIPIAVAALALLGTAAIAQTSPGSSPPRSGATAPATAPAPQPAVNPLTKEGVSHIQGQNVYGSDDAKLGSISEILMDPQSKKLDKFVVSSGGLMGIGSHRVAIPLDQFSWDGQKAGFKLSKNAEELKAMPEWVEGTATGSSTPPAKATGSSDTPKTPAPASGGNNSR